MGQSVVELAGQRYEVESSRLTYVVIPNGTLEITLDVVTRAPRGTEAPHCRLGGLYAPGRNLDELSGQTIRDEAGCRLVPGATRREFYDVASVYAGGHETVTNNVVRCGPREGDRLRVLWSGRTRHPDNYAQRELVSLQVDVEAEVSELPFAAVQCKTLFVRGEAEYAAIKAATAAVLPALDAELIARDWLAGRSFAALDLVVMVTGRGRTLGPPPPRCRDYGIVLVVSLDRGLVKRAPLALLATELRSRIDVALTDLDRRHPQRREPATLI